MVRRRYYESNVTGGKHTRPPINGDLDGRGAIVTSGNSGIDKATGFQLTETGANVPIIGRNRGRLVQADTAELEWLKDISELLEDGIVVSTLDTVFPLAEAQQAHELSEEGHAHGKSFSR